MADIILTVSIEFILVVLVALTYLYKCSVWFIRPKRHANLIPPPYNILIIYFIRLTEMQDLQFPLWVDLPLNFECLLTTQSGY